MATRQPADDDRRLRVVVETDDPVLQICDFVNFAAAGLDVIVCAGPECVECPVLQGSRCGKLEQADVVLNALRDPAVQLLTIQATRATMPSVPAVMAEEHGGPVSVVDQIALLRRGAGRRLPEPQPATLT